MLTMYTQVIMVKTIINTIAPNGWDIIIPECKQLDDFLSYVMFIARKQHVHPAVVRKVFNKCTFYVTDRRKIKEISLPSTKDVMQSQYSKATIVYGEPSEFWEMLDCQIEKERL